MTPDLATDPRGAIFITPELFADMDEWHRVAAEIRRDDPVMRVEANGWPAFWAITRHADVFEVSRRSDVFWNTEKSAPGPDLQYDMLQAMGIELPRTLVHLHGEQHQKLPRSDKRLVQARSGQAAAADRSTRSPTSYIERLVDFGGECDLAADLAVPFTIHVIMSIFGVPETDERLMMELDPGPVRCGRPRVHGRLLRSAGVHHQLDQQLRRVLRRPDGRPQGQSHRRPGDRDRQRRGRWRADR
ncbi:MAG: hypothetical protein V9E94_10405 [Microthrixaceae bacterium]